MFPWKTVWSLSLEGGSFTERRATGKRPQASHPTDISACQKGKHLGFPGGSNSKEWQEPKTDDTLFAVSMKTEQVPARVELKDQGLSHTRATNVYRGTGEREALCPLGTWCWLRPWSRREGLGITDEGVREHHRKELHSTSDNTTQNFIYTFPFTPIPYSHSHHHSSYPCLSMYKMCTVASWACIFKLYINVMSNSFHLELFFTHPHVKSIASATNHSIMYTPASYHTTPQCLQHSDTTNTHIPLYTCLKIHVWGTKAQKWELLRHRIRPGLTTCYQIGLQNGCSSLQQYLTASIFLPFLHSWQYPVFSFNLV